MATDVGARPHVQQCFITINAITFYDREVGRFVAGSPQLDVWSSGEDPKKALDRAQNALLLFLNETTKMGTVWKILEKAGIEIQPRPEPESFWNRLHLATKYLGKGDFFPLVFPLSSRANAAC